MAPAAGEWFTDGRRAADGDDAPRRTWVYRQLLEALRGGPLQPGHRLPSARRLAAAWGVSRGAVDDACAQLQAEGLVERRVGQGSFVARRLRAGAAASAPASAVDASMQEALGRLRALGAQARMSTSPFVGPMRLAPGMPDTGSFPIATWRRALALALGEPHRAALGPGAAAGVAALREAAARHLSLTRALRCKPGQVFIVGSPRQGMELVARVLLAPGACVCVEDPGPVSITRSFSLAHLDVVGVPPDPQGFDVAAARRLAPKAAAVVVQPLHHWPTGVRTTPQRRADLLDWCGQTGAWLVELDSLGEIVHDGAAPPPLQCSDQRGRAIFLGSFGALTFPSLRLAYLVLPEALVDRFAAVRGLMGEHNAVGMQLALAGFIDGGHLGHHVRAVRQLYRARRDALVQAVRAHLPDGARLGPVDGGIHACLHLGPRWDDQAVATRLNARGLAVHPLSRHTWQPRGHNGLLLGYGADDAQAIDHGLAEIGALLRAT